MILNTVAYRWRYYYTLDIILLTCNVLYPLLVVFNTYCVESLFCFASSCVPNVASFSGLSFFDCPFGIFYVYSLLTYFSLAIINVGENGRGNQE
jgi:hypothetical protein